MADRVTIGDVAATAGVSATAVSLVLNDRPGTRLSDDVRNRIRAAAADLGYRPNPAARSLRMGRTSTLGFISFDVSITRYASSIIRGAVDRAEELDHTMLIGEAGGGEDRAARAIEAMLDRRVDGLVIAAERAALVDLPDGLPTDLPVVMVNAATISGHPTVLPDERVAGEQITQVLLDAGHRRIALMGVTDELRDPSRSVTVAQRYDGIDAALRAAGIEAVSSLGDTEWEPEIGYQMTLDLLAGEPFTGLVCLNDRLAFGAYQALRERGLRIPDDVSIVSFDDDVVATYVRPTLTTAEIPYEQMGRRAVEKVLGNDTRPELVPMPLKIRGSVTAPRR